MKIQSGIKLGSATNLLNGYRAIWEVGDLASTPLFSPEHQPIKEHEVEIDEQGAEWSYPYITLHDTPESLFSTLFDYKVINPSSENPAQIPAGPLVIDDEDKMQVLETLKKKLKINISNPDYRYALIRLRREVGSANHPNFQTGIFTKSNLSSKITEEFHKKLIQLRHDDRPLPLKLSCF